MRRPTWDLNELRQRVSSMHMFYLEFGSSNVQKEIIASFDVLGGLLFERSACSRRLISVDPVQYGWSSRAPEDPTALHLYENVSAEASSVSFSSQTLVIDLYTLQSTQS